MHTSFHDVNHLLPVDRLNYQRTASLAFMDSVYGVQLDVSVDRVAVTA